MKIVAVMGSPRGMKGATGPVLEALLEATGAEVTTFCLSDHRISPCIACDTCHRVGRCPIPDDFNPVLDAMRAADGVVLASPNYIMSVTAQMKALFDRCCGPVHTQGFAGKYGAVVVTSGGEESDEVETYMLRFLGVVGAWAVGSVGTSAMELFDEATRARVLGRAADLGRRLAAAIEAGEPIPEQEESLAAFRRRMQQLVRMRRDEWTYEYEYWRDRGLTV